MAIAEATQKAGLEPKGGAKEIPWFVAHLAFGIGAGAALGLRRRFGT
jgi:hypothetical protein